MNLGPSAVDWNERRVGLPCRQGCGVAFKPAIDTVVEIGKAALERNAHELGVHGYTHRSLSGITQEYNSWTRRDRVLRARDRS